MSLVKKETQANTTKLSDLSKVTTLNPNVVEFVPFTLRSSSGSTNTADATTGLANLGTLGKAVLERSESSVSKIPDKEAHQY